MPYLKGVVDIIAQPLYDSATLAAAGQTQLTFFSLPIGQGTTSFGAGAKTLRDTNMRLAGQIPAGFFFTLKGFRIAWSNIMTSVDAQVALNAAVFVFTVASKPFLEVPANTIPGGNGLFWSGTQVAASQTANTQAYPVNGWPSMQNGFAVGQKPLPIDPSMNFSCQLLWPGGVQAISANTGVSIYLDGILKRPVQ